MTRYAGGPPRPSLNLPSPRVRQPPERAPEPRGRMGPLTTDHDDAEGPALR